MFLFLSVLKIDASYLEISIGKTRLSNPAGLCVTLAIEPQ
ncbi:MAG: hypothetical protein ACI8W3_001848 [Myxococcota bacterium]|jgi:hypothetical protein